MTEKKSLKRLRFAPKKIVEFYNLKLDSIYLNNSSIKTERVKVKSEIILENLEIKEVKVPAKRFVFDEMDIRGLLVLILEVTGQLKGLDRIVYGGGVINRRHGRSWGGGFDLIIPHKKKD